MHRTVTVTGSGHAPAVPDSAVVRAVVTHVGASVGEAVAGVEWAGVALRDAAGQVTAAERIATTGLQVWPSHDVEGRPGGFEASHHFQVRCDDLDVASSLVAALVSAVGDALRIDGVTLEVTDPRSALVLAREAAYADALARARHLAELGGRSVGDLLAVSDVPAGVFDPSSSRTSLASKVSFEPGELEVGASVSATWQLL